MMVELLTTQNPIHTYSANGVYEVCLTVTDTCGDVDNTCENVTVCGPLATSFSYNATMLSVAFSDLTGTASQWKWDFGDGATSTLQNPSHTYSANGSYSVCLIATNLCGIADTTCQLITVCGR
jgi:PKD repeat protein